jgi:REP element-mobilizing transposase RayT
MPRRWRKDYPGAWHHVMNRGVARRTLFETGRDVRYFLACLARQVRAGDLEIHAYSILTTHFHLLLRSPRGELSRTMQRVLDAYARWFNRGRRRDGPLFRGRFTNRLIESEAYWSNVVAYIDLNPVQAGLAVRPSDYPHGSAFHYARKAGPPWLRRETVEAWTVEFAAGVSYDPSGYPGLRESSTEAGSCLAERRIEVAPIEGEDPLDDLIGAAPTRVRDWMECKARLGDGTAPGWVLVRPSTVQSLVEAWRSRAPDWRVVLEGRAQADWWALEAGALRWFCGLRVVEAAARTAVPRSTAQDRMARFDRACGQSLEFRERVAEVLAAALAEERGTRRSGGGVRFAPAAKSGGGGRVQYAG